MRGRLVSLGVIGCSALLAACGSSDGPSSDASSSDASSSVAAPAASADAVGGVVCPTDGDEWEVAKIYIEHNATDEDTGIHGLIGGEPWRSVCVTTPDGTQLWAIEPADRLRELGVADFFWESNEPPNDEYSIDDLMADFPAGRYVVAGTGVDGVERVAAATFTHDIPAAPDIVHPPLVPDFEEEEPPVIDATGLVVRWEPVTETIAGEPLVVTGYEVIITDEEADDPNGWARPVFDVHVDPDVTELSVPDEFLQSGTLYELEVLAIESSGNQTIAVGFFTTT